MDAADQALVEFQKRNDLAILQAQLSAKQNALANYLGMNESLVVLQQNVKNLQDQLARRPADSPSNLGDDLAQLMLQVNAFSAPSSSLPIQLQMPSTGGLSDRTVGQQAAYLADLAKTIESKQAEAKKQTAALPIEIKALQGQIQETSTEAARLTRAARPGANCVHHSGAESQRDPDFGARCLGERAVGRQRGGAGAADEQGAVEEYGAGPGIGVDGRCGRGVCRGVFPGARKDVEQSQQPEPRCCRRIT